MAMKSELSTTIIRSGPRLFEEVSRRARIKKRAERNPPCYFTRAIDIGGFSKCRALGNGNTGNPRFHLDARFQNVLKRLAAARGDEARKLFGFRGQGDCQKNPPGNASAIPQLDIPAAGRGNHNPV
jgi:hypothetical protein